MRTKEDVLKRAKKYLDHMELIVRENFTNNIKASEKKVFYLLSKSGKGVAINEIVTINKIVNLFKCFSSIEDMQSAIASAEETEGIVLSCDSKQLLPVIQKMLLKGSTEASFYDYARDDAILVHVEIIRRK